MTTTRKLPDPFVQVEIPEGMVWQYEAVMRGGRVTHTWAIKNDKGAIHIHAALSEFPGEHSWIGGVEVHSPVPFEYSSAEPNHKNCWLLGGPCWHDGTSLYFSENIAPMLPNPFEPEKAHDMRHSHSYVTYELINWHRCKLSADF
jgi:hypothetical protein